MIVKSLTECSFLSFKFQPGYSIFTVYCIYNTTLFTCPPTCSKEYAEINVVFIIVDTLIQCSFLSFKFLPSCQKAYAEIEFCIHDCWYINSVFLVPFCLSNFYQDVAFLPFTAFAIQRSCKYFLHAYQDVQRNMQR